MTRKLFSGAGHALAAGMLAIVSSAAGCGGRASPICSADPAPAPSAVLIDVAVEANAGGTPFALGAEITSAAGFTYTTSMLRFYVSHVELVDRTGKAAPAVLADAAGAPLKYGVALVDHSKPESQVLHLLAPRGSYQSISFSVGVPKICDGGSGELNHENASEQTHPLNVDADMYWGWDSGYVFFKIEGHSKTPSGANKGFAFHFGDDSRYVAVNVPASIEVAVPAHHHLMMDINRMFTSPSGQVTLDMTGAATSNAVHGGKEATMLANNLKSSGVFSWKD